MWGDKRKLKLIDMYYRLKTMKLHKKIKNKFLREEVLKKVVCWKYIERNTLVRDVLNNPSMFSFKELEDTLSLIDKYEYIDKVSRGENGNR